MFCFSDYVLLIYFFCWHQHFISEEPWFRRGCWDPEEALISVDFPRNPAFLHADFAETPSWMKSLEGSAVRDSMASMSGSVSMAGKRRQYLGTGTPSGPTRSFSEFQATSSRPTRDQAMNLESVMRAAAFSLRAGRTSCRKTKTGCACAPFTLYLGGGKLGWSLPLSGTCLREFRIF